MTRDSIVEGLRRARDCGIAPDSTQHFQPRRICEAIDTAISYLLAQEPTQSEAKDAGRFNYVERICVWTVNPDPDEQGGAVWSVSFQSPYGVRSDSEDDLRTAIDSALSATEGGR